MFPFHHGCELSFQNPNNEVEEQPFHSSTTPTHSFYINQDIGNSTTNYNYNYDSNYNYSYHAQILNNDNDNIIARSPKSRKGGPSRSIVTSNTEVISNKTKSNKVIDQDGLFVNDVAMKRSIHRDVERQRRHEMSNLYSSLRSLLPSEYIKGKRSICDHISEAAKYIKDLERSVKELGDKREKLKGSSSRSWGDQYGCGSSSSTYVPSTISYGGNDLNVSVHTLSTSLIQIEVTVGFREDEPVLPLSRVLEVMFEQGFDVVSSVSSKVNKKWIYVIHCEVNDVSSMDLHDLERRLRSSHIVPYDC